LRTFVNALICSLLPLGVLIGCTGPGAYQRTVDKAVPSAPVFTSAPPAPAQLPELRGMYHTVAPRETLFRISQIYGVPMEDIIRANRLQDPSKIRRGQALFIPHVDAQIELKDYVPIPLFPNTGRWKYIVVHHTATRDGNKDSIDLLHRHRGFGDLGYHFIIDNGTKGRSPGQIEVGNRWLEQRDGAHTRADNMNQKGIGVALIGNFSEETLTDDQLKGLVYLVNTLRHHYKVPKWRILGHREVRGAATECPGNRFPWQRFKRLLDAA
jgi:LysM repeat protein